MLETIREYAAERLELSDEASTLRRRHAEHFLALAEEAEPNLIGVGRHAEWLDRLERDHDNFRAALDWLEASGDSGGALRLAAALWRFWDLKGHLIEGRRYLERALRADERPTAARAKALSGAADMALTCGDVATGRLRAEEALELFRTLGDDWGTAFSLLMFAYGIGQEGDWPRAQQLFGESVQRFRDLGDEHYALRAARAHAWAYYEGGDLERSRELYEDILPRARATHHELVEAIALFSLAEIAADEGRVSDAVSMLEESHRILRELNDLLLIATGVGRFASLLAIAGRAATAAKVLSSSTALVEEIGARPPWFARISRNTLAVIHTQLDEAAFAQAWEEGLTMTADEAVALAVDSLAAAGASA
jgi:predicted ATPase